MPRTERFEKKFPKFGVKIEYVVLTLQPDENAEDVIQGIGELKAQGFDLLNAKIEDLRGSTPEEAEQTLRIAKEYGYELTAGEFQVVIPREIFLGDQN